MLCTGVKVGRNAPERSSGAHQFGQKRSGAQMSDLLAGTHVPRPANTSFHRSVLPASGRLVTFSEKPKLINILRHFLLLLSTSCVYNVVVNGE